MPFGQQPSYLFRDNDGIYGDEVGRFLAGTGIAKRGTSNFHIATGAESEWASV